MLLPTASKKIHSSAAFISLGASAQPFIRVALWSRWPPAPPWRPGVAYCGWQRLANAQRLPIAANGSTGTSFGPALYWFRALAVGLPTTAWLS